jgi:hypothetical protein
VRDVAEGKLGITDELLVAYLDDELDAAQRAMVSATLDENAGLRRRAAEMRLARELLHEAFPLQSADEIPARIDAAAEQFAAALCSQRPLSAGRKYRFRLKYAVAATVAAFAAGAAVYFAQQSLRATPQGATALARIDPASALHKLLESTPSAQVLEVPEDGATLRAVLSFRADDGRFCREFEIFAGVDSSSGIACREKGRWHIEVLRSVSVDRPSSNNYTPAAGSDDPALAVVAEKLTHEDPLGAEEEAQVLNAHWGRPEAPDIP